MKKTLILSQLLLGAAVGLKAQAVYNIYVRAGQSSFSQK